MREAIRRPTRDGVLGPMPELLAPCPRALALDFLANLILIPLHYPPQGPCAFRRADPKKSAHPPLGRSKNSIFGCFFAPKMTPKASQNSPKLSPNSILFRLRFHIVFSIDFGCFFIVLRGAGPSI